MDRDEQKQFKQMQIAINELTAMVCSMAGVIAQLPGADKIEGEKAVAIGNSLMPAFLGFQMQSTSMKTAASILAHARSHQDELSHREQA